MYNSKKLSYLLLILVISISLFVTIYIYLNQKSLQPGYDYFYLLPLSYLLAYLLFIHRVIYKYGISMFMAVYLMVSFFRYVILSYLVVSSGWYLGRSSISPSKEKFNDAIFLMIYELIVYNLFIYIFHKKLFKVNMSYNRIVYFSKNNFIYLSFIVLTLGLVIMFPDSLKFFSFFKVNNNYMNIEELNIMSSITVICINLSKILLYFIFVRFIITNFAKKHPVSSILLVSLVTISHSLIFFGANRSDFIFSFIINILILIYLYKRVGLYIAISLITLLPIVLSKITEYRNTVTITGGANKLVDFTDTLQVYLAGVYNVAISLEMGSDKKGIILYLADIFRSAIGPNIILKNFNIVSSSKLFNERIFLNDRISQIIPMIGQGNFYVGALLSPIIGVCFIFIAIYLTKKLIEVRRIELIFVFSLFSGRIGFVMAQNGNILLNDLTFYLPLFLLVYYLNNKVGIKYEKLK